MQTRQTTKNDTVRSKNEQLRRLLLKDERKRKRLAKAAMEEVQAEAQSVGQINVPAKTPPKTLPEQPSRKRARVDTPFVFKRPKAFKFHSAKFLLPNKQADENKLNQLKNEKKQQLENERRAWVKYLNESREQHRQFKLNKLQEKLAAQEKLRQEKIKLDLQQKEREEKRRKEEHERQLLSDRSLLEYIQINSTQNFQSRHMLHHTQRKEIIKKYWTEEYHEPKLYNQKEPIVQDILRAAKSEGRERVSSLLSKKCFVTLRGKPVKKQTFALSKSQNLFIQVESGDFVPRGQVKIHLFKEDFDKLIGRNQYRKINHMFGLTF